jgi:hypothetical protein
VGNRAGIAYSPKLESVEKLPHDLYDEWYVFKSPTDLGSRFEGNVFETSIQRAKLRPSSILAVLVCTTLKCNPSQICSGCNWS